jgi:NitT/TauT family transport system substrate-binding protein
VHGRRVAIRKVLTLGISLLLVAGYSSNAASAAAATPAAATPSGPPISVTIGSVPIAGYAALWVGDAAGFFKDANINLTIAKAAAFANIVASLQSGEYQFGSVGAGTVISALTQNVPLTIVATAYYSDGEQQVMVPANSPIKTITDLAGKRIGLGAMNNNFQASIVLLMKAAGVDTSKVNFTLIPPANLAASLRNGTVDAAQINEPDIAANGSAFRAIIPRPFASFGTKPVSSYVIANTTWAAAHPDIVSRFVAAYNRGAELAASDKQAVIKAIASISTTPIDTLQKMIIPGFTSDLLIPSFTTTSESMYNLGFVTRIVTPAEAFYKGIGESSPK